MGAACRVKTSNESDQSRNNQLRAERIKERRHVGILLEKPKLLARDFFPSCSIGNSSDLVCWAAEIASRSQAMVSRIRNLHDSGSGGFVMMERRRANEIGVLRIPRECFARRFSLCVSRLGFCDANSDVWPLGPPRWSRFRETKLATFYVYLAECALLAVMVSDGAACIFSEKVTNVRSRFKRGAFPW
jgi:hypothetical protein